MVQEKILPESNIWVNNEEVLLNGSGVHSSISKWETDISNKIYQQYLSSKPLIKLQESVIICE